MVKAYISDKFHPASLANYRIKVEFSEREGLIIDMEGYNDRLVELFRSTLKEIFCFVVNPEAIGYTAHEVCLFQSMSG